MKVGREESRAVQRYLDALAAEAGSRRQAPESLEHQLAQIDEQLAGASPMERLHLAQKRLDVKTALVAARSGPADLAALEEAFVKAAPGYAARKGLSFAAFRSAGVDAAVLKRAGLGPARTRKPS